MTLRFDDHRHLAIILCLHALVVSHFKHKYLLHECDLMYPFASILKYIYQQAQKS